MKSQPVSNLSSTPSSPVADASILDTHALASIMSCLEAVGAYGEVHLVVKKGRIQFIRTVRNEKMPLGGRIRTQVNAPKS